MIWIKPNGQEIEINDRPESIAKCEEMGWKRKSAPKKKRVKKEAE